MYIFDSLSLDDIYCRKIMFLVEVSPLATITKNNCMINDP